MYRRSAVAFIFLCALVSGVHARQQALMMSDKITDLTGTSKRDPPRGTGGICGVPVEDSVRFDVQNGMLTAHTGRFNGQLPISAPASSDGYVVASTYAAWLKLTMTTKRNGGYTNVVQDVFILNRDRSELTLWRTLNTVMPDGSSGKIIAAIASRSSSVGSKVARRAQAVTTTSTNTGEDREDI